MWGNFIISAILDGGVKGMMKMSDLTKSTNRTTMEELKDMVKQATFLLFFSSTERMSFRIKDFVGYFGGGLHRRQHPRLSTVALYGFSVFQCVILSRLSSSD